ncbi:MAG: PEP-CTERM sorting domain-containing protein [Acetobacteraceae bacterium]|nr:PEP-CTERM sorting domain-containing protein [Acetobacteraceae bacterium]
MEPSQSLSFFLWHETCCRIRVTVLQARTTARPSECSMTSLKTALLATALVAGIGAAAQATPFTTTSPTSQGALPAGVTEIGGVVVDLIGLNGVRVVAQAAASSLFVGNQPAAPNPFTFGTLSGFTPAVIAALGGGLAELAVRVTLFDGDSKSGNFDFNDNQLTLNGTAIGNFSAVATQQTNGTGTVLISSGFGFGNNTLETGFFSTNNAGTLATIFASLGSGSIAFGVLDNDPGDQFYDFRQGVDGGLINVGSGPQVVPEPASMMLLGAGLLGLAAERRRRAARTRPRYGTLPDPHDAGGAPGNRGAPCRSRPRRGMTAPCWTPTTP